MGRKPAGWLGEGVGEEDPGFVVVIEGSVESEVEGVVEVVEEVKSEVAVVVLVV